MSFVEEIIDWLRQIKVVPDERIFEMMAPPEYDEGQKVPFIVVSFGTPSRSTQDRGIGPAANDIYSVYFLVHIRSATAQHARELADKVMWHLVDFQPSNSGPVLVHGGQGLNYAKTAHKVPQYGSELYCSFVTNLARRV